MTTPEDDGRQLTAGLLARIMLAMADQQSARTVGPMLKQFREAGGVDAKEILPILQAQGFKTLDKTVMSHIEAGRRKVPEPSEGFATGFVDAYIRAVQEVARRHARAVDAI